MAPPNDGLSRYHKYGSVDDSEQPTAQSSSFLPRSSRSNTTINGCPDTVGEHKCPPQQNKSNVRDPAAAIPVSRRLAVTVVCGLAFLAGSGVSWVRSSGSQTTGASPGAFFEIRPTESSSVVVGDDADDVATLEFTALNFYHIRDGKPGQDYPWLKDVKLIEPHRDTTLAVVGPREGFDYRWEVRTGSSSNSGRVGEVQATATGAVTIVVLTQLEEHVVVLKEVDGDGKVTNRLEETVLVKYVRREIRTLTDDEREELMDAVSKRNKKPRTYCASVSVGTRSAYHMYLIRTYADLTFVFESNREVYDLFQLLCVLPLVFIFLSDVI